MKRALPFVIIIGVLGGTLFATWYWRRSAAEPPRTIPSNSSLTKNRASVIKLGADPAQTLGSLEAAVMLEEFGDFECQSCGLLHPILKTMKAEFGPNLVIVFREFPLVGTHPHALQAAQAAEAAGRQGKFWEMHDLLYENQKTWHEAADVQPIFAEYATRIGLAVDQFKQDLAGEVVARRLALDRERGYSIGVNSTPTLFLNGHEVPLDSMTADKLRVLINAEIKSGQNKQ